MKPQPGTVIDLTGPGGSVPDLQAVLDALPRQADAVIRLGALRLGLQRPILVTKHNVTLAGSGAGVTRFEQPFAGPSVYVGPLDDTTDDGFRFSAGGRPDLFGVLDKTLAAAPGTSHGFATQGRTLLYAQANAAQLGGWTDARWWDYWSGGCTVELIISPGLKPGDPILGWGDWQDPVGPGCAARWADRPDALVWQFAFEGEPPGRTHAVTFTGIDWTRWNRLRWWYDRETGTAGGWNNGKDLVASWWQESGEGHKGKALRANRRDYPFQFGRYGRISMQGGPVPDVTLAGLCLSNVPVKADPGTDALRYGRSGPGIVSRLAVEAVDPGRLVRLQEGAATMGPGYATGRSAFALALDAKSLGKGVGGFTVSDLSFTNGGVMLCRTFNPTFVNVAAAGSTVGLSCLRFDCNYTVRATGCKFGGSDAAESLYHTISEFNGVDLTLGGITSLRDTGSSLTWTGGLATFFGPCPESGADLLEGQYGGQVEVRGVIFDNEAVPFSKAAYRVENSRYSNRSLVVTNGCVAWLSPGAPAFLLSSADSPDCPPAHVSVAGFVVQGAPSSVRVEGPAGRWFGSIDTRGWPQPKGPAPASLPVSGPGYDPARLVVK